MWLSGFPQTPDLQSDSMTLYQQMLTTHFPNIKSKELYVGLRRIIMPFLICLICFNTLHINSSLQIMTRSLASQLPFSAIRGSNGI
jgi:hypothetical protein